MLEIPQCLRQIDVVVVRILKPEHLVPHGVDLPTAVVARDGQRRHIVYQLPGAEDRNEQLTDGVIRVGLPLPRVFRVEDFDRLGEIGSLVVQADVIRFRLARFAGIETVDLLEVGIGDLGGVFADLDLRDDIAVRILLSRQLVYAAEYGVGFRGDEPFADPERVDAGPLTEDLGDEVFVQGIGYDDLAVGQSGFVVNAARLAGEIRDVAGIDTDGAFRSAGFP